MKNDMGKRKEAKETNNPGKSWAATDVPMEDQYGDLKESPIS